MQGATPCVFAINFGQRCDKTRIHIRLHGRQALHQIPVPIYTMHRDPIRCMLFGVMRDISLKCKVK